MPNSPRGAPQGARSPPRILLGGSNIARVFCVGMPKTGEAKFPMTPGPRSECQTSNIAITEHVGFYVVAMTLDWKTGFLIWKFAR